MPTNKKEETKGTLSEVSISLFLVMPVASLVFMLLGAGFAAHTAPKEEIKEVKRKRLRPSERKCPADPGNDTMLWATLPDYNLDVKNPGLPEKIIPILRNHGALGAGIFGSFARGDEGSGSDLDILVELPKGKSLLDLVSLKMDLEAALGFEVDVVTYKSLHPLIRKNIPEEEKVIP